MSFARALELILGFSQVGLGHEATARWERVEDIALELRQRAALGLISTWGRLQNPSSRDEGILPLTLIPAEFWVDHDIDLSLFHESQKIRTVVGLEPANDIGTYIDIVFNSDEIMGVKQDLLAGKRRVSFGG